MSRGDVFCSCWSLLVSTDLSDSIPIDTKSNLVSSFSELSSCVLMVSEVTLRHIDCDSESKMLHLSNWIKV